MIAVILAGLALAGCSSQASDWAALYRVARASWEQRDAAVSLNEAAAIPYATLGIRIDGGPEQVLVLATDTSGTRMWTSSAAVTVLTRAGRIVRTSGFGTDLTYFASLQSDHSNGLAAGTHSWSADFADLGLYAVPIRCAVSEPTPEPITILGAQLATRRIDETCQSAQIDWHFTNTYWVSSEGRVWKAIQHFHPKGPEVETELLRPPFGAD